MKVDRHNYASALELLRRVCVGEDLDLVRHDIDTFLALHDDGDEMALGDVVVRLGPNHRAYKEYDTLRRDLLAANVIILIMERLAPLWMCPDDCPPEQHEEAEAMRSFKARIDEYLSRYDEEGR